MLQVLDLCRIRALAPNLVPDLDVESDSAGHRGDFTDLERQRGMALGRMSYAHRATDERRMPGCTVLPSRRMA
ncbi:hypothetical protein U1Q18_001118, partial [Sarracenia purpurea var. burkii]